jgi:hypothetical protein
MKTTQHLALSRCPHCNTADPTLQCVHLYSAAPMKSTPIPFPADGYVIQWHIYSCASCVGLVAAAILAQRNMSNSAIEAEALWIIPAFAGISADIPSRAANYLNQSRQTLSSPRRTTSGSMPTMSDMLITTLLGRELGIDADVPACCVGLAMLDYLAVRVLTADMD